MFRLPAAITTAIDSARVRSRRPAAHPMTNTSDIDVNSMPARDFHGPLPAGPTMGGGELAAHEHSGGLPQLRHEMVKPISAGICSVAGLPACLCVQAGELILAVLLDARRSPDLPACSGGKRARGNHNEICDG